MSSESRKAYNNAERKTKLNEKERRNPADLSVQTNPANPASLASLASLAS